MDRNKMIQSVVLPISGFESRLFLAFITKDWMQTLFYNFSKILKCCESFFFFLPQIKFSCPWPGDNYSSPFYVCFIAITPKALWLRLMALRSDKSDIICHFINSCGLLALGHVPVVGQVAMFSFLHTHVE